MRCRRVTENYVEYADLPQALRSDSSGSDLNFQEKADSERSWYRIQEVSDRLSQESGIHRNSCDRSEIRLVFYGEFQKL